MGLYLPEYDLYGNPRIFNGIIDIGCNEWDGTPNQDNNNPQLNNEIALGIYPNPFECRTTMTYTLFKSSETEIAIYNLKGQKVRTITDSPQVKGKYTVYWNGSDNNGTACSTGIYLVNIVVDGKTVDSRKVTLIR